MLLRLLPTALLSSLLAVAQVNTNAEHEQSPDERILPIHINASDIEPVPAYTNLRIRMFPTVATDGSGRPPLSQSGFRNSFFSKQGEASNDGLGMRAPDGASSLVLGVPAPGFYPADLTYHGGAVLKSVESHNLFLDQPASHWGYPGAFLHDLRKSTFVHTIDQYVDETANDRYTVGGGGTIPYPITKTLGDKDLFRIVHAAASLFGTGYGHIYHVFLPKGVDFCEGSACYSPDKPATFYFCAFHGSVQFTDIGHVVFSLEPYQDVTGCAIEQPSPNGSLRDSTASILSHELFEAITDPDSDGWWAQNSGGTFGQEIGDLCSAVDPSTGLFKSPISTLNGKKYEIQMEYSNTYHACANVP